MINAKIFHKEDPTEIEPLSSDDLTNIISSFKESINEEIINFEFYEADGFLLGVSVDESEKESLRSIILKYKLCAKIEK